MISCCNGALDELNHYDQSFNNNLYKREIKDIKETCWTWINLKVISHSIGEMLSKSILHRYSIEYSPLKCKNYISHMALIILLRIAITKFECNYLRNRYQTSCMNFYRVVIILPTEILINWFFFLCLDFFPISCLPGLFIFFPCRNHAWPLEAVAGVNDDCCVIRRRLDRQLS